MPALAAFLAEVRADFTANAVNLIYGTVRLVERDDESFLAWATQPWACVIFNLHVAHDEAGLAKAAEDFRRLIDRGLKHGGSYYLTYHRWANRAEVAAAYPQFPRVPAVEAPIRPRGTLPERLVSPVSRFVRLWSLISAARKRQIRNAVIPITLSRRAAA